MMRNKNPIRKYLRFTKLFNNKFSNLASLGIYSKSVIALKETPQVWQDFVKVILTEIQMISAMARWLVLSSQSLVLGAQSLVILIEALQSCKLESLQVNTLELGNGNWEFLFSVFLFPFPIFCFPFSIFLTVFCRLDPNSTTFDYFIPSLFHYSLI